MAGPIGNLAFLRKGISMRIAALDDDPLQLDMLVQVATESGHSCHTYLKGAALQQDLTRAWPELQVVAVVGDGRSAVRQALALRPDVLFFDIRMPGQSGIEAAAELADAWPNDQPFPALVFATAYDQYAVQAFEAQAVDYLLKPIQADRLARTVAKVQGLVENLRHGLPDLRVDTIDALAVGRLA